MIRMIRRKKTRATYTTLPTAPTMMYNKLSGPEVGREVEGDDEVQDEGTGEGSAPEPRKNMATM